MFIRKAEEKDIPRILEFYSEHNKIYDRRIDRAFEK